MQGLEDLVKMHSKFEDMVPMFICPKAGQMVDFVVNSVNGHSDSITGKETINRRRSTISFSRTVQFGDIIDHI
jgi:hypothetical protein